MTKKFSIEILRILNPNRIGHLFHEYIMGKEDIPAKIKNEIDKKIYFVHEREAEMYFHRLKTEYYKWAKESDIPTDLKESGWESYMKD